MRIVWSHDTQLFSERWYVVWRSCLTDYLAAMHTTSRRSLVRKGIHWLNILWVALWHLVIISHNTSLWFYYKKASSLCLILVWHSVVCLWHAMCIKVSLGTLVPNSRDWHEKIATEFFALQNTPYLDKSRLNAVLILQ